LWPTPRNIVHREVSVQIRGGEMTDRRIRSIIALAAMFALAGGSAAAAPGDLDPSFGRFGVHVFESNDGTMDPTDVAVQADGKLVVSGRLYSSGVFGGQPVIIRFAANGRFDDSFGDHGVVVLQPPADAVSAIEVDPSGRIVAAARSAAGAVVLARLNPSGVPDPAFGTGGIDETAVQAQAPLDLALTFPGEIVVVGGMPELAGIVALKRLPDGGPDPSFSSDGVASTPPGAASYGGSVAVLVDGSVFAGGTRRDGAAASSGVLAKFRADGELDPTFGSGGVVLTSASGEGGDQVADLGLGPGATVSVLESSSDNFTASIARFGPSGALDPTFAGDGRVVIGDVSFSPRRIVVQPDGRIVAALGSRNGDARVLRYRADGKLDLEFGDRGEAAIGFGGNLDNAEFVARGADGRIAIAGERGRAGFRTNYYDLAVARLLNRGHRQDLDADGFLDRRDRCPKVSAARHGGCPFFERGLTLRPAGAEVAGRVTSPDNGRCRRAGRVELLKKRPGRDLTVASTSEIHARGRYELPMPAGEGVFYTRAPAVVLGGLGLCGGARSDRSVSA
jgi:uncharacterized delta-60 repeat protein